MNIRRYGLIVSVRESVCVCFVVGGRLQFAACASLSAKICTYSLAQFNALHFIKCGHLPTNRFQNNSKILISLFTKLICTNKYSC